MEGENFRYDFPGIDVSTSTSNFKNNAISFLVTIILSVESEWPDGPKRVITFRKRVMLFSPFFKLGSRYKSTKVGEIFQTQ